MWAKFWFAVIDICKQINPRATLTAILLVLFLASVGCGNGDGGTDGTSPPPGNPTPSITSSSPNSGPVAGADFTLTLMGSGFISGSIVRWNGTDRTTTFVSSTQLEASISASDVASAGTA